MLYSLLTDKNILATSSCQLTYAQRLKMTDHTLELVDFLQNELVAANDRAIKAETKLLDLQLKSFIDAMNSLIKSAEAELTTKETAYEDAPDELSKGKLECERRIEECNQKINAKKEICDLCYESLSKGLTMAELPPIAIDKSTIDVKRMLENKLLEKRPQQEKKDKAWQHLQSLLYTQNAGEAENGVVTGGQREAYNESPAVIEGMHGYETLTNKRLNERSDWKQQNYDGGTFGDFKASRKSSEICSPEGDNLPQQQYQPGTEVKPVEEDEYKYINKPQQNLTAGQTEKMENIYNFNKKSEKYATSGSGKDLMGSDVADADWTEGNLKDVVNQLASEYKIGTTIARKRLEEAAKKVGSIQKLDAIWKEAENVVKSMLKPTPLQQESKPKMPVQRNHTHGTANQKSRLCNFYARGYCGFAENCRFAHGEEELYRTTTTENWNQPMHHPEPCNNQECPEKLKFLLRKTEMCPQLSRGQACRYGESEQCRFVHKREEIQPMPKWEICERAADGRCKYQRNPIKCVYAHSPTELRSKPKKAAALTQNDLCVICHSEITFQQTRRHLPCGHNEFHTHCFDQWSRSLAQPYCPICTAPTSQLL